MIIRSVRLKNIKSYGAGRDDLGVTVEFEPGVNRIAGRNGHGKSTLIEAIGFALFLAKPAFAENFAADTYFLRSGCKEGEIDVAFEHRLEAYRIERGVGSKSKRRTKMIDLADDSICAEGDAEVSAFLRRLLEVPTAGNLSEIFSKLVGVKQGRLTWPFDSKPSEAKKFFEPLFDVAVFRDCFDRLRPARDQFARALGTEREKKAAVDQKISDRADSEIKLKRALEHVTRMERDEKAALQAREDAGKKKADQEKLKKDCLASEIEHGNAKNALQRAKDRFTAAKARVEASEQAVAIARKNLPAHEAFRSAEARLKTLEDQREQRDALKEKREAVEADRKDRLAKADAARGQARSYREQKTSKDTELAKAERKCAELDGNLSSTNAAFEKAREEIKTATEHHSKIASWIQGLRGVAKRLSNSSARIQRLDKEVSAWNPGSLALAKKAVEHAETALAGARANLARATERQSTLKGQLQEISGGICPFLKETCRQFNPQKVQADLAGQERIITDLKKAVTHANGTLKQARVSFEPLQKAENQLAGKKESLATELKEYLDELGELCPAAIQRASVALLEWDRRMEPLPDPPAGWKEALRPEGLVPLHGSASAFIEQARDWWDGADRIFRERVESHDKKEQERTREAQTLKELASRKTDLAKEIQYFTQQASAKEEEAGRRDGEAAALKTSVAALDVRLKPFAPLATEIKTQRARRDVHREGHEDYLQAKKRAEDLEARKTALAEAQTKHDATKKILIEKKTILEAARKAFDPENLAAATADYEEKRDAVTSIQTNLQHARRERETQQARFTEWREALGQRGRIDHEMERLAAAIDITELARRLLQKAAPAVAQHLCDRIAARAQIVFNRINPDPIQLSWDAQRYSVRIVPGDRRFAMLSGGEQTKLALALTLAMIEEFGGLRFCIFDEPTYGVDAGSRQRLADAIIEAQSAAGLEQLLLVSHDDAFEGKIEHAILLNKSAASGSELAAVS